MKRFTKYSVGLGVFLLPVLSFASQRVGNGGYVVVCNGGSANQTIELLDYSDGEYRFPSLQGLDLLESDNPYEIAQDVFKNLESFDEERSNKYIEEVKQFESLSRFISDDRNLPNANNDFGEEMTSNNCIIEQVAANTTPSQPEEAKYWIKKSIWDQLSAKHQAGLIVHEIIYNDALKRGHTTSEKARFLTFLFSSLKFKSYTQEQYNDRMTTNHMFEYMAYSRMGHSYLSKLRYFHDFKLSHANAKSFCENLPGISNMLDHRDIYFNHYNDNGIFHTAIGRKIAGPDGLGREQLWVLEESMTVDYHSGEERSDPVQSDGEHSFICKVKEGTE